MADETTIEQPEEQVQQEDQQAVPPSDPPSKKMYDLLVKGQLYSKSFDDFQKQYSTPDSIDKLYKGLNGAQLYSKSKGDFYNQYFPTGGTDTTPKTTSLQDIKQLKDVVDSHDTPVATPMGEVKSSEIDPNIATGKKLAQTILDVKVSDFGSKIGIEPAKVKQVLADFPNEVKESGIQSKAILLGENPVKYDKLKAADENVQLLFNSKNGGTHVANAYNDLQGTQDQPIQDLNHLQQNIDQQREIIYSTLDGANREKALANLEKNRASSFNATNPELIDEYNKNTDIQGQLNATQYAGLKSIQTFEPEKYQLYSTLLKKRDDTADDTVEMKIGLEKVKKELLDIGRKNTANYINENQYDLDKVYKGAQTDDEKNQIANQFLHNKSLVESIDADSKKDTSRFPYLNDLEFERQAKELSGTPDMGVVSYALNKFGRGVGAGIKAIQNVEANALGTDQDIASWDLQQLGESEKDKNAFYLPEADKPEGSPFVYQFDKSLQDAANKLKNDKTLTDQDRAQKLIDLIKNNPDQVHTVTNTAQYGKSASLFSKATLYKNAGMIGDIASIAAQQAGMGGAGVPKLLASTVPMYLSTQNDFYKQALEDGRPNPMAYANTHAAIMMAAGMINPDLSIVKRSLGVNTELGKTIAGISENTWKDIVSENKPLINKIKNSLTGVAGEAAKMGLTYGAGTSIASDLANRGFFNSNLSNEDILNDAIKATKDITTSSIALLGLHGISNFKSVSPEEKARVWELGDNYKLAAEKLDDAINAGDITSQVADQRKAVIKQVSKLIDNVPTEDAKGKPLTDQQRADYLYNLIIKSKADGIKADLPEAQKAKLEAVKLGVDIDNNAILDPKSEKENLMQRKRELTDDLSVGEDGKSNLTPLEKKTKQAELDEINTKIEEINSPKTNTNGQTETGNQAEEIAKSGGANELLPDSGAAPSISVIRPGELSKPEIVNLKTQDHASAKTGEMGIRDESALQKEGSITPPGGVSTIDDELPFGDLPVGIAHEVQVDRAKAELNVLPPERGEGITLGESIAKGKLLLEDGADVGRITADFEKDKKVSSDMMATVRAAYTELAGKTNLAYDKYGPESPEAKSAFTEERSFYNNSVKPMQTEWSKIGVAQQGAIDIDTGSIMGLRRAFNEKNGKDFTPKQEEKAKELSETVKGLTKKVDDLQEKLEKALSKSEPKEKADSIKEAANKLAKKIRDNAKLSRPGMFSAATPASLVWDGAVEVTAKAIEAGGEIAQAISNGLEHIKNSEWYKGLSEKDKKEADTEFSDWHLKQASDKIGSLAERFADKKDSKFTTKDAKDIWDHAKENYIDKGVDDFDDMIHGTATDLGLTPDQVRHAISEPKGAKVITDQMYTAMNQKRLAVKRAELWVKSANTPRTVKFLKAVPGFFFAAKTFGHGTVGGITHAGMNIFRPSAWHTYWPFFFKQFKYAFGKTADYEKAMADHVRDKDYTMWKRAGLAVDPTKVYEEYGDLGKYFGKIGLAGERGFNALKVYRLAEAKRIYNGLSATEKADPQTVKEIAKIVNHSTGTTEVKVPSGFNVAFFAPKLEVSRWQRLIQEPVKAAHTFANWKNADVSDKVAAKIVARHAGEMLATYMGALAANAALLSLSGSKQKINIAHPMDNDWMKFKAGGKTIDVSGGMLSTSRFIATLINEARVAYHGDKTQKQSPTDKLKSTVWNQMRFKASPFMGTVLDGITGVDAMGRPLPFSKVKPKKGEKAYTVGSYLLEQQTPIPVAEAIKTVAESMKEKRMSTPSIIQILNGVTAGAISGGTGAHVIPDFKLAKKK